MAVPKDKFKRIFKDFSTKVTIVNDAIKQVPLKEARDRIAYWVHKIPSIFVTNYQCLGVKILNLSQVFSAYHVICTQEIFIKAYK